MFVNDREQIDNLLIDTIAEEEALSEFLTNQAQELGILDLENETENDKPAYIFSNEQIAEAAFAWFRQNGFPYRKLSIHKSMQEINKLALTDNLINSQYAYQVADTYHPHRFHAQAESSGSLSKSPVMAYEDGQDAKASD